MEHGNDGIEIFHNEKLPIMLGANGISNGVISKEAMERGIEGVIYFHNKISMHNIKFVYASATSAVRNATNGGQFLEKIKSKTGINVEVISGEREAELIFNGVKSALKIGNENVLVMDIGGGSCEFIIADQQQVFWKRSFEIGAQRLLDLYHKSDPINLEEVKKLHAYLELELNQLIQQMDYYNPTTIIGSSGTFDTLSEMYRVKENIAWNQEEIEQPLTINAFIDIYNEIITKNRKERLEIPGMIEMRVDMIVVASILIHFIIGHHKFQNMRVSSYALKEGIMMDFAKQLP